MMFLVPQYTKEGKAQLIIGIGCMGEDTAPLLLQTAWPGS